MQRNSIKNSLRLLLTCFLTFFFFTSSLNSYAHDGVRDDITFDTGDNMCDTGSLTFDPLGSNDDINWVISNPTCASIVAGAGAFMLAAGSASSHVCFRSELAVEEAAQQATGVPVSPANIRRVAQKAAQCNLWTSNPATLSNGIACCSGVVFEVGAIGIVVAGLSILWDVANITYKNARICGHDWTTWAQEVAVEGESPIWRKKKGPRKKCLEDLFLRGISGSSCSFHSVTDGVASVSSATVKNKNYREFIYGGVEFEDNGDDACKNPITWDSDKKIRMLGYDESNQHYYMTGAGNAPVYACHRFLVSDKSDAEAKAAYECCKTRSQNSLCIENRTGLGSTLGDYDHKFCGLGDRCTVENVVFEVYQSRVEPNYVCAETYSLCPYDHPLGGGTEDKKMMESNTTLVENFCQYMNHCAKVPLLPHVRQNDFDGAYISSACKDMKGDSQNSFEYNSNLIPTNTRGFSAPMAQCFKETMENIFLHKAGETVCLDPDESPSADDECTGGYKYRKGEDLPGKSFFLKIQDKLQGAIKMAVTIAIVFVGVATLFAVPGVHFSKKELLPFIWKIGLVMYFAIGDGWQFGFMKGILDSSNLMSEITFRPHENPENRTRVIIDREIIVDSETGEEVTIEKEVTIEESIAPTDTSRLDGCQFPRYDYSDSDPTTKYEDPKYPPTKGYLRIWDTLDCKIAKALGFGPDVSVPNLVSMVAAGFFTGGLGIVFVVASFTFAFLLISLTVKALHIFLMATTSIVILIYVSPITITLAMFKRTKGIFDQWWKQVLGYALQPMILFAYLGIFLMIFDKVMIGPDVTFVGEDGDPHGRVNEKTMVCSNLDANESSVYCIFRNLDIDTYSGLEKIGIGIPFLTSMNQDKLNTLIKAALIMFILMKFIDQISALAARLVGGEALQSDWNLNMAKNSYKALRGMQKRGMGLAKKAGGSIARGGINKARKLGNLGNTGKAIATNEVKRGSDVIGGGRGGEQAGSGNRGGEGISSGQEAGSEAVGEGSKSGSDSRGN